MTIKQKINWYELNYWGNEEKYVRNAFNSTWLSGGTYIQQFEKKLEEELKIDNILLVSNGTAALQITFLAIGLKPGDEVIIPSFGFLAAANILKLMHIKPVFVDVEPEYWNINHKKIESKITKKTKAILVIHNYGVISDIEEVKKITEKHQLYLIEDCAEAILSQYQNKYAGSFGDISTFSFHATKTIACGEGGAIACKDNLLLEKLKLLRSHGLKRKEKHYWHEYYGNNFRMSNLLAAVGLAQLEKREEIIRAKNKVLELYRNNLIDEENIVFQKSPINSNSLIWAIAIYIDFTSLDISRDNLLSLMRENGIECRPGFYTPYQLDIYDTEDIIKEDFMIANDLAKNVIVLPSYPKLGESEINYICGCLKTNLKCLN
jgi:perosamine synthetase